MKPITLALGIVLACLAAAEGRARGLPPARLRDVDVVNHDTFCRIAVWLDRGVGHTLTHSPSNNTLIIRLPHTKSAFPASRRVGAVEPYVRKLQLTERDDAMDILIEKSTTSSMFRTFLMSDSRILIVDVGLILLSQPDEEAIASSEYLISPQDVLDITIFEHPELNQRVRVSSAGTVTFPLLDNVKVSSLSASQIGKRLEELLGVRYLVNPQVTVQVRESANIYVLGEVEKPGVYKLRANLTVVEAITIAGGFTKVAARNRTRIVRTAGDSKKIIAVPVDDVIRDKNSTRDIRLQAEDMIIVPETFF